MARKSDKLRFEPMYKPGSTEEKPAKRKPRWKTVLRNILSLVGGQRGVEPKTKEKEA